MRRFSITETDRQLILSRDRTKDVLLMLGVLAAVAVCIRVCFLQVAGRPALPIDERIPFLMFCFVFGAGYLWGLSQSLRRQVLVADSAQLFLNDQPFCPLWELQSVHLEQTYYRRNSLVVLYLLTKNKVKLELARDGIFGVSVPEMQAVAEKLADYMGINLVTPDGFNPGRNFAIRSKNRRAKRPRNTLRRSTKMRNDRVASGIAAHTSVKRRAKV